MKGHFMILRLDDNRPEYLGYSDSGEEAIGKACLVFQAAIDEWEREGYVTDFRKDLEKLSEHLYAWSFVAIPGGGIHDDFEHEINVFLLAEKEIETNDA